MINFQNWRLFYLQNISGYWIVHIKYQLHNLNLTILPQEKTQQINLSTERNLVVNMLLLKWHQLKNQQFARNAQRQREQAVLIQQKQQEEEDRLRFLEEQRMRENEIVDEALREMERAEQERVKKQGARKPSPISQISPTLWS